jgi:hypothetical protein
MATSNLAIPKPVDDYLRDKRHGSSTLVVGLRAYVIGKERTSTSHYLGPYAESLHLFNGRLWDESCT